MNSILTEQLDTIRPRLKCPPRYLLFLFVFLALTSVYLAQQPGSATAADAQGTTPGGTIPPGGTLPSPVIDPEQGQVRVIHLAPVAVDLGDTTVDICTEADVPVTDLTGLQYGEQSSYVAFAPGAQDWYVGTPGCSTNLVDIPLFYLARGSAITIIISGDGTNQPLRTLFLVDATGEVYKLYLPIIQR